MTKKKSAKKKAAKRKPAKKKVGKKAVKKKASKKTAKRSRRPLYCPCCGKKLRSNGTCGNRDCPCYGKTPANCMK